MRIRDRIEGKGCLLVIVVWLVGNVIMSIVSWDYRHELLGHVIPLVIWCSFVVISILLLWLFGRVCDIYRERLDKRYNDLINQRMDYIVEHLIPPSQWFRVLPLHRRIFYVAADLGLEVAPFIIVAFLAIIFLVITKSPLLRLGRLLLGCS